MVRQPDSSRLFDIGDREAGIGLKEELTRDNIMEKIDFNLVKRIVQVHGPDTDKISLSRVLYPKSDVDEVYIERLIEKALLESN